MYHALRTLQFDVAVASLMQIKIPRRLVKAGDAFSDWGNVLVAGKLRRLDILLAVGFIAAVIYGWYDGGPWYALLNGLMFIMGAMIGLWFF